jgi:isopropylmalate/homocitrate/citramalate synthase
MIKRFVFRIDDAEGMNAVLASTNYISAIPALGGVVDGVGYVNFTVEDGEPDSNVQLALEHKKKLAKDLFDLEMQQFDLDCVLHNIDSLELHRSQKEIVENKKEWEASCKQMDEFKSIQLMKEAEVMRLKTDIALRRDRITDLLEDFSKE